jgi:hypothetical protein
LLYANYCLDDGDMVASPALRPHRIPDWIELIPRTVVCCYRAFKIGVEFSTKRKELEREHQPPNADF